MSRLYAHIGVSKQAAFRAWRRQQRRRVSEAMVVDLVRCVRGDHPHMGLRKIHRMLCNPAMGRDRFEAAMKRQGLQVHPQRSATRTTHSQRRLRFPNLLKGLVLTDMHQLWVTDITYIRLLERFAYLVTILDVYTRRILAAVAHLTLQAEANVLALQQALRRTRHERGGFPLIHHSDYGSQYIDEKYLALLRSQNFQISMCEEAWENPYVERVQGTLKNEYLVPGTIRTLQELRRRLPRAVELYNGERPHQSLPKWMTPNAFAIWIRQIPSCERPVMVLDNTPSASSRRLPKRQDAPGDVEAPALWRSQDNDSSPSDEIIVDNQRSIANDVA